MGGGGSETLPTTGMSGLVIGGLVLSQAWLLAIAFGLVVIVAVSVRYGWRRSKAVNDR
jgi:hypothetical protein